jgi:drug/metabolite transporter (DMT)-like permease
MVLLAGLGYAVSSIWVRTRLAGAEPVGIAAGTLVVAALLSLPAAVAAPGDVAIGAGTAAALLALGAGGTGAAFLIYYRLIADVGTSRAAVVAYLAPGFAVLYGAVFLAEPITAATIGGLALILAGSWIAAEGRLPWQPRVAGAPGPSAEVAQEPLAEDAGSGAARPAVSRS